MARPVISPLNIQATAPETFSVLQQRMCVVEEQTESLISNLQDLGISGERFEHMTLNHHHSPEGLRPISPVRARPAFTGESDTLWRNCENLVNRMCRMESVIQTLKLNIFRLHTDQKLNPKHSAELEHRLIEIQEEHAQELRNAKVEIMRLRQRLSEEIEEREREEEAKERLSAALEIATATKTDVALAAEEMKATKLCMSRRVRELEEQLSQEADLRASLEEMQAIALKKVQDMKWVVEEEREHVRELQQDCQAVHREGQEVKDRLQKEEERNQRLEQESIKLQTYLESQNLLVSQLQDQVKSMQQSHDAERTEFAQAKADSEALREAAEKVQSLNEQLEEQCSAVTAAMQQLTAENAQLLTKHQQDLKVVQDTMIQQLQEQELKQSVAQSSLEAELQILKSRREQLEKELETLQAEQQECQRKASNTAVQRELHESTIARLKTELESALREKSSALKRTEQLQEQMNKSLNNLEEEKQNLEMKLTEHKLELGSVQNALQAQEQENRRLMEQVAKLEQEQHAQRQVESLLHELTESKNKLAYEKGKLQSTVDQLQSELQSVCDAQSENVQLRRLNTALETKYTQANTELDSCRIRLQRFEVKLQQTQNMLLHKEEDFALAVQSRDGALKEEKRIRAQMEVVEEREKKNREALQQQLWDIREEKNRLSGTLENVLSSHTQLQIDFEKLQTELGRKDCDITALHRERAERQKQVQKMEAELSESQTKLLSTDSQQRAQAESLRKAIEVSREDNKRLARATEQALQQSVVLQCRVSELENKLQSKDLQEQQLQDLRIQAEEDTKKQTQMCEERLAALKRQHRAEREAAKKGAQREIMELKKALEESSTKSADISRTNRELRSRKEDLEKTMLQQRDQIRNLKTQLKSYVERKASNKQSQKDQDLVSELKHMELVKEEYEKSNKEQAQRIQQFLVEVSNLRAEIAAASQNTHKSILQSQLEKETQQREELEESCRGLKQQVKELQEKNDMAEQKLREASVESEQISLSLEEAHSWFHSRFEELQKEIVKNKHGSSKQYPENEMMTHRENDVKLPPPSAVTRWETKQELKLISRKFLPEGATKSSGQ
ncbi:coiled-coil domain-containing protein 150 [Discoglossus pictus]